MIGTLHVRTKKILNAVIISKSDQILNVSDTGVSF